MSLFQPPRWFFPLNGALLALCIGLVTLSAWRAAVWFLIGIQAVICCVIAWSIGVTMGRREAGRLGYWLGSTDTAIRIHEMQQHEHE